MSRPGEMIANKLDTYLKIQSEIEERRNVWHKTTKPYLHSQLDAIGKHYGNGLHSQVLDSMTNNESVNLTFGQSPSGLQEEKNGQHKHYIKVGGALVFSLLYTGKIMINVMYPYIEELSTRPENVRLVNQVDPTSVDQDFIFKQVLTFLDEMIKAELDIFYTPIGFRSDK